MALRCLIADDDPLVCEQLETFCEQSSQIEYCLKVQNGVDALSLINSQEFDLIFLDLNMQKLGGRDLIKLLPEQTQVVIISAESDFAVEAFKYNVVGYLLKPFQIQDFLEIIQKLSPKKAADNSIYIKDGGKLVKVDLDKLLFVKSESNYASFQLDDRRILSLVKLTELETKLPGHFLRVHRSYIVSIHRIDGLEGRSIILKNEQIPVSDSHYEELLKRINQL